MPHRPIKERDVSLKNVRVLLRMAVVGCNSCLGMLGPKMPSLARVASRATTSSRVLILFY